jgi:hypothetical protein
MHKEMLIGVKNDKIINLPEEEKDIPETTIPKKYYKDAGMEESLDKNPIIHAHRPYGDSEFIR